MAARFWRYAHGIVLPAIFCWLAASSAYAGSFQVNPMLIEVMPDTSIATYTLRNTGDAPLNVQVTALRWTQSGNQDHYAPPDHLLVVPQIVSIPPGQQQLVRVALRGPRPAGELAYRLHFDEIPAAPKKGFFGVRTLLSMNLPLFFLPSTVTRNYSLRLSRGEGGASIVVTVNNTGTRYLRISHLALLNVGGEQVGELGGPLYILPGKTRHWALDMKTGLTRLPSGTYRLNLASDSKHQIRTLTLH